MGPIYALRRTAFCAGAFATGAVWYGFVIALICATPAGAQGLPSDIYGTHEIRAASSRLGQKTTECSVGYRAMFRPTFRSDARAVSVTGDFGVRLQAGNKSVGFLRLAVHDLVPGSSGLDSVPIRLRSIFVATANGSTAGGRLAEEEMAPSGTVAATFAIDDSLLAVLTDAINTARLTIFFRRPGIERDIAAELDLTVTATEDGFRRVHSSSQIDAFSLCLSRLLA